MWFQQSKRLARANMEENYLGHIAESSSYLAVTHFFLKKQQFSIHSTICTPTCDHFVAFILRGEKHFGRLDGIFIAEGTDELVVVIAAFATKSSLASYLEFADIPDKRYFLLDTVPETVFLHDVHAIISKCVVFLCSSSVMLVTEWPAVFEHD